MRGFSRKCSIVAACVLVLVGMSACSSTGEAAAHTEAAKSEAASPRAATTQRATTEAVSAASSSEAATAEAASSETLSAQNNTPATTTEAEEIPRMPKVGMSESLIDATELGAHDEVSDVIDSGKWKGGVTYYWRSKNGKNDMVFSATVLKGKVAKVERWNTSFNYWADGTLLGKDFPDVYASGEQVEKKSAPVLEDPLDYTNGEEYADNAYKYFEYMGSDDPWNDALNYWDQNGP